MHPSAVIRCARESDAPALLAIYAPYVKNTAITFEYDVPNVEEFAGRIHHIEEKFPYLVAEVDGRPVGYAYVSPFQERAAYSWAVETSIYVERGHKRMGIGTQLYIALESALRAQGILNANACIAYPGREDTHLTKDSVLFHEKMGYRMVGEFHSCGYKFGQWYNMVWMEKMLGVHKAHQASVKPFPAVEKAGLWK